MADKWNSSGINGSSRFERVPKNMKQLSQTASFMACFLMVVLDLSFRISPNDIYSLFCKVFPHKEPPCGAGDEKAMSKKKPKQNPKGNNVLLAETMKICSNWLFSCSLHRDYVDSWLGKREQNSGGGGGSLFSVSSEGRNRIVKAEARTEKKKKCALVISCHPDCQRYSSVCSVTFCVSVCKLHAKWKLTRSFEASVVGCMCLSLNNYCVTSHSNFTVHCLLL